MREDESIPKGAMSSYPTFGLSRAFLRTPRYISTSLIRRSRSIQRFYTTVNAATMGEIQKTVNNWSTPGPAAFDFRSMSSLSCILLLMRKNHIDRKAQVILLPLPMPPCSSLFSPPRSWTMSSTRIPPLPPSNPTLPLAPTMKPGSSCCLVLWATSSRSAHISRRFRTPYSATIAHILLPMRLEVLLRCPKQWSRLSYLATACT